MKIKSMIMTKIKLMTANQQRWLNDYFLRNTPVKLQAVRFNIRDLTFKQATELIQLLKNGADKKILNQISKRR